MHFILSSIRNKLLLICGSGTGLLLIAASIGLGLQWRAIDALTGDVETLHHEQLELARDKTLYFGQLLDWKNVVLRITEEDAVGTHWEAYRTQEKALQAAVSRFADSALIDATTREMARQFLAEHRALGERYGKALDDYRVSFDIYALEKQVRDSDKASGELLDRLVEAVDKRISTLSADANREAGNAVLTSAGLMVASCVVAFALFLWLLQHQLIGPARELEQGLHALAKGDFSQPIQAHTEDELGRIARSAEALRSSLGMLIASVGQSVARVDVAARQVADESREVAESGRRQAQAAGETAQGVESVTESIRRISANTDRVSALSGQGRNASARAAERLAILAGAVDGTSRVMQGVSVTAQAFVKSAQDITSITQQVREIAEQTNLLALNAAIEAARAGDQGRGFAVVADEVRKLAEKSSHSASEIDAITGSLGEHATQLETTLGEGLASLESSRGGMHSASEALAAAHQAVDQSSSEVAEISREVREQSESSGRIAENMEQMARMVERNLGALGRMADTAGELHGLAGELKQSVARFQL